MAKLLDPLNKCIITNKILADINASQIKTGDTVTITFTTKGNGDIKEFKIETQEKEK